NEQADTGQQATIEAMKAKAAAKKAANQTDPSTLAEDTDTRDLASDENQSHDNDQTTNTSFYLKVYSPYKLYFEGQVESVTAENRTGTFDILKGHKNFLTLLSPCDLKIRSVARGEEQLKVNRGVMHVKSDRVVIFLDV
ncbi:F0F1 ATP synthase subunit epsilon, partial [Candidatus Saccharibacteria bacterium]|nr:F0F1 ATP synthase subunit epsilon [Candidatus Saccharibacteria bacterium]